MWPGDVSDVTYRKHGLRFEKKSMSWVFASEEEGWLSELAEALRQVSHVVGGRWKSQHRKIVYLSPYVEKPFNLKVIKSFVPELRSRKCFCVSYVIYMCVMNILCLFHIFMYGYDTIAIIPRSTLTRNGNAIWGPILGQIELFIHLIRIIIFNILIRSLKPLSYV